MNSVHCVVENSHLGICVIPMPISVAVSAEKKGWAPSFVHRKLEPFYILYDSLATKKINQRIYWTGAQQDFGIRQGDYGALDT